MLKLFAKRDDGSTTKIELIRFLDWICTDEDYLAFEPVIVDTLERRPMRILGYCLMPNRWHFVLWPERDGDLAAEKCDHHSAGKKSERGKALQNFQKFGQHP